MYACLHLLSANRFCDREQENIAVIASKFSEQINIGSVIFKGTSIINDIQRVVIDRALVLPIYNNKNSSKLEIHITRADDKTFFSAWADAGMIVSPTELKDVQLVSAEYKNIELYELN